MERGDEIEPIDIKEDPFDGREMVKPENDTYEVRYNRIQDSPPNHTDRVVLDVIRNLFNNSSSTGFPG
ncbi:MAG: hypothetical protein Ct9H300mP9_5030 [Candidatus Neomarinimicrobiota bacterium]|nr:MAG: hypothetical protein Ct9H300mP9_5030 [Candidatus Neomarinimicrobiota bacterium]